MSILLMFKVWAYEAVDVFGKLLGGRSTERPNAIPRLLRWHRGESHKNLQLDWFEDAIAGSKVLKSGIIFFRVYSLSAGVLLMYLS